MNIKYSLYERLEPIEKDQNHNIPNYPQTFEEISKQLSINAEIKMKEVTDHVDREIKRFNESLDQLKKKYSHCEFIYKPDVVPNPPIAIDAKVKESNEKNTSKTIKRKPGKNNSKSNKAAMAKV